MTASVPKDDWKFAGSFIDVGTTDVDALERVVRRIRDSRWTTQRPATQLAEYLEPIVLVQEDVVDPIVDEMNLAPILAPVLRKLAREYGPGVPALISLVRLRAHTTIPQHRDGPDALPPVWTRRTHTAILTNPGVVFDVAGERRHIARGEIVELNNWREHSVRNDGSADRVHLLVDWTPFVPARRVA